MSGALHKESSVRSPRRRRGGGRERRHADSAAAGPETPAPPRAAAQHAGSLTPPFDQTASPDRRARLPRQVLVVVFDRFQLLDATGPVQVFSTCNEGLALNSAAAAYQVTLVSSRGGLVSSSSGIRVCTESLAGKALAPRTTLVIAGGAGAEAATRDERLVEWLYRAAQHADRVCSMGSGAFLLACRGLLDDREVVTHWHHLQRFADLFPRVRVHGDSMYVKSGKFYSSAGDTAGIDLCLYLVGEHHGRRRALGVAKHLAVPTKRPGGQAQFRSDLPAQAAQSQRFDPLVRKIKGDPGKAWSVEEMASLVHMTTRSFHRCFVNEMTVTPAQFVVATRLETASTLIQLSKSPLKAVARKAGFGSEVNMKNAFRKLLGITPTEYQERFRR